MVENEGREEACEAVFDAVAEVRDLDTVGPSRGHDRGSGGGGAGGPVNHLRIRMVAKEGALSALAASKPRVGAKARDYELEQASHMDHGAEVARLSEACRSSRSG